MAITISREKYNALFFDLDHTLWDYDTNSRDTLDELFQQYVSTNSAITFEQFLRDFKKVNDNLWDDYNRGKIDKDIIRDSRFVKILELAGIDNVDMAKTMSEEYLFSCPRKPKLLPNALEALDYLAPKYDLHILTNGFDDVQAIKMECAGIGHYFDQVITSESIGCKKPAREFFDHALLKSNTKSSEVLMIGDNLKTDIAGAHNSSIDSVYFNPSGNGRPHIACYEIKDLSELLYVL